MTEPAPATPGGGLPSPLAYPQVCDAVSRVLREAGMGIERNAVVWKALAAAFEGARAAGLLTDSPPPPPRWIRRALLLRKRRDTA